jgi:hypothetical protein
MPEVHSTVHKTMVQANRCQVGKIEGSANACMAQIDGITSRLVSNESAIQSAAADVQGVVDRVGVMCALAGEVARLARDAESCSPRILELCSEARRATSELRAKVFTDAKQRQQVEEEAARREVLERKAREEAEQQALDAQVIIHRQVIIIIMSMQHPIISDVPCVGGGRGCNWRYWRYCPPACRLIDHQTALRRRRRRPARRLALRLRLGQRCILFHQ